MSIKGTRKHVGEIDPWTGKKRDKRAVREKGKGKVARKIIVE